MIKSVEIKNFQSHKDTRLDFVPGVNVIVGASDSGKTAIIRALRWVIENRPTGEAFRSYWGGDTRVIVDLDGIELQRIKGKANQYILIDHINGYDQEFVAFGNDIPDEVLKALNINQINTQFQLDSPFLLSRTSGEVAVHFNKIARIDQINTGTQKINSALLDLKRSIDLLTHTIEIGASNVAKYADLPKLEANLEILEELHKSWTLLLQKQSKLNKHLVSLEKVKSRVDQLVPITYLEGDLLICEKLYDEQKVSLEKSFKLNKIQQTLQAVNLLLEKEEFVDQVFQKYTQIEGDWLFLQEAVSRVDRLIKISRGLWDKDLDIRGLEERVDTLTIDFEEVMPKICPLCEQDIEHKH